MLEESLNSDDVINGMQESLDFHAAVCMPEDATADYPDLFKYLWQVVTAATLLPRNFSKFAIGLPRGMGKSMWVKLLVCFVIFFTKKRFILVVCASEIHAQNMVSDICDVLDSENCRTLFGNWQANLTINRKDFKKFTFLGRSITLKAVGRGTATRGITVKNKRPDIIICDDAQTDVAAHSPTEAAKFIRWFRGPLMKAKSPSGCTFLYIGNMYPDKKLPGGQYTCMLRQLQMSKYWTSIILGAINNDGTALWEEVQPLGQLLEELQEDIDAGTPEIFYAEVMNDPSGGGNASVDVSKISIFSAEETAEVCTGKFIVCDPSNDKKNSDDAAVGYFEVYNGTPHLAKLYAEKLSGPALVARMLELAAETGTRALFIESHAYQYSLIGWIDFICEQNGISQVEAFPIYTHGLKKNSRILNMFRDAVTDQISFDTDVWPRVNSQISLFDRLRTDNTDDILDICAYATQVMIEHDDLILTDLAGDFYGSVNPTRLQQASPYGTVSRDFADINI